MLQTLHEKFSGLIAKIILGVIVVIFGGFFGIQSYMNPQTETFVASVNGREISQDEFRDRYNQFRSQMQRMYGKQFNALEFDTQRYRMVLGANQKSAEWYQEQIRHDLAIRQVPAELARSAVVTDAEVNSYVRLRDQTRDFRYVKFDKPTAEPKVSDADIEAYYKAHGDEFMTAEKVSLDYVELDAAKMQSDAKPDDETLKKRYEEQKARFLTPEQRLASHILVKLSLIH